MTSIAHYLFASSNKLVKLIEEHHADGEDAKQADAKLAGDLAAKVADQGLSDKERHDAGVQLAQVRSRIAARKLAPPATVAITLPPAPADDKAKTEQIEHGRHLFSTRGCLACHQHGATTKEAGQFDGKPVPIIDSDRTFGPELTHLAAKIGTKANDPQSARAWLVSLAVEPGRAQPAHLYAGPVQRRRPTESLFKKPTTLPRGCLASRSPTPIGISPRSKLRTSKPLSHWPGFGWKRSSRAAKSKR